MQSHPCCFSTLFTHVASWKQANKEKNKHQLQLWDPIKLIIIVIAVLTCGITKKINSSSLVDSRPSVWPPMATLSSSAEYPSQSVWYPSQSRDLHVRLKTLHNNAEWMEETEEKMHANKKPKHILDMVNAVYQDALLFLSGLRLVRSSSPIISQWMKPNSAYLAMRSVASKPWH